MRKSLLLAFLSMMIAAGTFAQPPAPETGSLTKDEREKAIAYLKQTKAKFLDSIKGLSDGQWKFKPAPDRWSVAEVAEHIGIAEQTLFGMITGQVMASPADPSKREAAKGKDEMILKMIPDRTTKAQAPEILKPTGRWATRDALTSEFEKSRDKTIGFIKNTTEPLRDHFGPNPVFKELDAYQWVLFMAAHSERHTLQILEVKADQNFPKKKKGY
ncbi:MAG TPA: DinB family protein [Pyrinomonadaceae bacterium]|nr:DinB family protein [Pyrinomonadaceae bacterium]